MCTIMGYCGKSGGMEYITNGLEATVSRGPDDCRIIDQIGRASCRERVY